MIKPQLCREIKDLSLLDKSKYYFQIKKDGECVILNDGKIFNREGADITDKFPEIKAPKGLILHGELVTIDEDFGKIQSRVHLDNWFKIKLIAHKCPAMVWVFDIIGIKNDPYFYRNIPLSERVGKMERITLLREGNLRLLPFYEDYEKMLEEVKEQKLEGIVAKPKDLRYMENDRTNWLKWKNFKEIIIEFNGFEKNPDDSITLTNEEEVRVKAPAFMMKEEFPVRCEIQYLEKTENNKFRFPSFKRLVK